MRKILLGVAALFLSANVNAALISIDWKTTDDNLVTRDTSSGMEWLDFTESTGYSFNYVSSQFGVGGQFEGWRYASSAEVSTLLDSAGGSGDYTSGWTTGNNGVVRTVIDLMGNTTGSRTPYDAIVTTSDIRNDIQHWAFRLSDDESTTSDKWKIQDWITLHYDSPNDVDGSDNHGNALIRVSAVPIPAAAWLFGSGLLGLVAVARRKTKS